MSIKSSKKAKIKDKDLGKKLFNVLIKSLLYFCISFCLDGIGLKLLIFLTPINPYPDIFISNINLFWACTIIVFLVISIEFILLRQLFSSYTNSKLFLNRFMFSYLPIIHFVILIFFYLFIEPTSNFVFFNTVFELPAFVFSD